MKRSEILENRKKVIEFLKQPERIKNKGSLVSYHNQEARCCLGHMCEVLIPETKTGIKFLGLVSYDGECDIAPSILVDKLGLHCSIGGSLVESSFLESGYSSLSGLNDNTDFSPQEIGLYLESVIEGGYDTPWKHLNEYTEE